ncbi:hypothetical protein DL93DRAFT_2225926 [Clavulina sp. PMI_390]|nr:hypothetical protein DL93DRAFT_2225926 [Clavulina sp. PMI_390]
MDDILHDLSDILDRLTISIRSSPARNIAPLLSLCPNQRTTTKETALRCVEETEATLLRVSELEKALVNARTELFRQRAYCLSCLVPISCLSPDVLRLIFSFTVERAEEACLLRRICRSWRDVAVSQRALWSRFTFSSNRISQLCGDPSFIYGPPTELIIGSRDNTCSNPLVRGVGQSIAKCIVYVDYYKTTRPLEPIMAFQELLDCGLPNLRFLDVLYRIDYSAPFIPSVLVAGALPSLRVLPIRGSNARWAVAFPALQQLHLDGVEETTVLNIIALAPALRELIIESPVYDREGVRFSLMITAAVQVLTFKGVELGQLVHFLNHLPLHELRSLTIDGFNAVWGGGSPRPVLDDRFVSDLDRKLLPRDLIDVFFLQLSGSIHLSEVRFYGADHNIIACMAMVPRFAFRQLGRLTAVPFCGGEYQSEVDAYTPQLRDILTNILRDRENFGSPPFEKLTVCEDLLCDGNWGSIAQELVLFPRCTCDSLANCIASVVPVLTLNEPSSM